NDDRESMYVDNNPSSPFYGRIYVSWNDFNVGGGALYVTSSSDGGTTWSSPHQLTSGNPFIRDVQINVGPDGTGMAGGMDEGGGALASRQNYFYRSTDGGSTFTNITEGSPFPGPGRATCGYFAGMYTTPTPGYFRYMGWGDVAIGPDGVVHYVYTS